MIPGLVAVCVVVAVLVAWKIQFDDAKGSPGSADNEIWAVPEKYDSQECDQAGTITKITYQTKAYGTDMRCIEKSAYVYLPYGYDETEQYNILYLMHGTGDNEAYWFDTHAYNKTMVDHMIASGDINPLIIVTPTFYVEDDCMDELDALTYSFAQELRNDLMPAVESAYSTYAESCDPEGFANSRDHRAFAGLSRGAVTMFHSAMCASLDYFSWFGGFSGSRTPVEYFRDTIQSEEYEGYSIHYLYVSSGNFDFALLNQIQEYRALLEIEPRLTYGENTVFDVYPMQYHSVESWHLALYNFLQKIF
jgi:enterochelin esterase-like enzyme